MNRLYADAELTAEEQDYLNGGQVEVADTPAAPSSEPQDALEPDPAVETPEGKTPASGAPTGQDEPSDDDDDIDEHLVIDPATGRQKDSRTGRFVKTVPHQALHRERERRKAAEEAAANERVRFARADERMNTLMALAKNMPNGQPQPKTPTNPMEEDDIDPTTDIVAALDQQKRRNAYLNQQLTTDRKTREEHAAEAQVVNTYKADATRFMQTEPAFADAYKHLIQVRHKQMELMGIGDAAQRNMQFAAEEKALVHAALQQGRSPAQILWDLSVAAGFQKPAAQAQPKQNGHQQNVQKLQQQQRGMAAAASLSGAGSAGGALTWAKIADMNQDEFDKLLESGQFNKLMYG